MPAAMRASGPPCASGDARFRTSRRIPLGLALSIATLLALAAPDPASAQIASDTPRLISPYATGGLGLHLLRPATLPEDEDAALVTWALPGLPSGMRLRGGVGRSREGQRAGFAGLDIQAPLMRRSADVPIDLEWQAGAGVGVGQYVLVSMPVGLTAGVEWSSGAVWLAPYLSAGLTADLRLGEEAPAEEFGVDPSLDLGLDLSLDRGRRVVLRSAMSLGDRQALAVGLVLGAGRGRD